MLTDPTWQTPATQSCLLFTDLPSHHSIDNDLVHHVTFQHLHPVAVIRARVEEGFGSARTGAIGSYKLPFG